jgi:DNA-binding NtrC family response regulator/PAS domain-containing protein
MKVHPIRAFLRLRRSHVFLLSITLAFISSVVVYQFLPDISTDTREYPFEFLGLRQDKSGYFLNTGTDFFGDSNLVSVRVSIADDRLSVNSCDYSNTVNYNLHHLPLRFFQFGPTYRALDIDLDGADEVVIDLYDDYTLTASQKSAIFAKEVTLTYFGHDDTTVTLDKMSMPENVSGDWLIQHDFLRNSDFTPLQTDSLFFILETGTGVLHPHYKLCMYRKGDPPVLFKKFAKSVPMSYGDILKLRSGAERTVLTIQSPNQGLMFIPPASSPVAGAVLDTISDSRGGVFQLDSEGEIQWTRSFGHGGGGGHVYAVGEPSDTVVVFYNQQSFLEDGASSGCHILRFDALTGTTIDSSFVDGIFKPFIGPHVKSSGYIGLLINYDGITNLLNSSGYVDKQYSGDNNSQNNSRKPLFSLPTGELAFAEFTRNDLIVVRTLDCNPVSVYNGNGSLFMATFRDGDIEEDRLLVIQSDTVSEFVLKPNKFLLWRIWKMRWPIVFGLLIPLAFIGIYYYILYSNEKYKTLERLQNEVKIRTKELEDANITLKSTKTYLESILNASEDALITFDISLGAVRANETFMRMFGINEDELYSLQSNPETMTKIEILFHIIRSTFSNGSGQSDQYIELSLGRVLKVNSTIMNIPDQSDQLVLLTIRDVSRLFNSKSLGSQSSYPHIIGESEPLREVFGILDKVKQTDYPLLILGESGTGKDLVAQAIHQTSKRRSAPFIAVNCAAIDPNLQKSELFGFTEGSFTGATHDHLGYFAQADKGTLFLDEVGDLRPDTQSMLLRVLESGEYERIGDKHLRTCDVRIIAATNRSLTDGNGAASFRMDLYHRLNVVQITMPNLRDRSSDIPLLIDHFLTHFAKEMEKQIDRVSEDAMKILQNYSWPGNVRELRNAIAHAVIFCKDEEVQVHHLREEIRRAIFEQGASTSALAEFTPLPRREWDRDYLIAVLENFRWNKRKAAEALSCSPQTLYNYLSKFTINPSK